MAAASLADIATLLRVEREHAETRMEASEAKLEQQRRAMEAKLEAKDAEMARRMAPPGDAIAAEQLAALQTRLEGLHAAQLLADEVRAGPPRGAAPPIRLTALVRRSCTRSRILWPTTQS